MPKRMGPKEEMVFAEETEFEVLEDDEPGQPPTRTAPAEQQQEQQQPQQPQGVRTEDLDRNRYQYPYPQYQHSQQQQQPQYLQQYQQQTQHPYPQYQHQYPYPYGYPPYPQQYPQYPYHYGPPPGPQYPPYGYYPPGYYLPPETPEQVHLRKKRFWTNPLMMILVLVLAFVLTLAITVPIMVGYILSTGPDTSSAYMDAISSPSFLLVMTVIQNLCFAATVYLFYVYRGMFSLKEMGFHTENLTRSIVIGVIVGMMLFLISALAFPSINNYLDPNGQDQVNDPITRGLSTPANIVIIFMLVSIVAPLGEEFFFRGLLFRASKFYFDSGNWGKDLPLILSMVFSGLMFSVVHFYGIAGTLLIFGLGMLLAYVCHHTNGLVAPILVHALYNAGVIVGVLAFS